jgi:aspartate/methionine/tyrosine aminotransferase
LSPGTPVQLAAPAFLAMRHGMQEQIRRRVAANLAYLDAALRRSPVLTRLDREGGWYAVLRVPRIASGDDLVVDLLEKYSVLVHPGHFFDFAQEGFLVVSLITPENEFQQGIIRLRDFFAL